MAEATALRFSVDEELPALPESPEVVGKLGEYLIEGGRVTKQQLDAALAEQQVTRERLGLILVRNGFLSRTALVDAVMRVAPANLYSEALFSTRVPPAELQRLRTMVVAETGRIAYLATLSSEKQASLDLKKYYPDMDIHYVPAVPERVDRYLRALGGQDAGQLDNLIREALVDGASDIHIIPRYASYTVMMRLQGVRQIRHEGPIDELLVLTARIKDRAHMDLAERRIPQDGGFQVEHNGRLVDLRIVTLPTADGEYIVMRLLDPDRVQPNLGALGITHVEEWRKGVARPDGLCLICGPTGCHGKGTPIIMYDGVVRAVEDVAVGDILMGPDSAPREVTRLFRGIAPLYKIVPNGGGDPFTANGDHVLSLVTTPSAKGQPRRAVNITVHEYLKQSKTFKHTHKLYRAAVDWPEHAVPLDPYILGVLLGGGCLTQSSVRVCVNDVEIQDESAAFAAANGAAVSKVRVAQDRAQMLDVVYPRGKFGRMPEGAHVSNPIKRQLKNLGLNKTTSCSKFIPDVYKTGSREQRLALMAGLIDTDGHASRNCYDYISKSQSLALDIAFVARSLGAKATVSKTRKGTSKLGFSGEYWRVHLSGGVLTEVPVRLTRKRICAGQGRASPAVTGFTVEKLEGAAPFYGFSVTGDNLYLLGDFTVTHNSGKTTSVNSTIRELDRFGSSVFTVEDPVEYRLSFTGQVNVNKAVGMDFAQVVRAFMRADPDVIVLGEVRDPETAANAMRAADTGHLVLATLHTGSIHGAVQRMRDLGVKESDLLHVLRAVLVQRLVRTVCPACHGAGCPQCRGTGYSGRTLVSETVYLRTEADVQRILKGEAWWVSMLDDAVRKLKSGITDRKELERVFGIAEIEHALVAADLVNPAKE